MYPYGLVSLIKDVISSREVIAVTLALLLFLKIVFYVSASYRKPINIKKIKLKRKKPKPETTVVNTEGEQEEESSNDELGLKEA
jgi:hypothetical protein